MAKKRRIVNQTHSHGLTLPAAASAESKNAFDQGSRAIFECNWSMPVVAGQLSLVIHCSTQTIKTEIEEEWKNVCNKW